MSKHRATYLELRAMEGLLFENTLPLDKPTNRAWFEGWSYDRVAKAVNKSFSADHARRVAKAVGLEIVPTPPPPSLEDRVRNLEGQITQMAQMLQDVIVDFVNFDREFRDANPTKEWAANPDYAEPRDRRGHGREVGLGGPGKSSSDTLQYDSNEGVRETGNVGSIGGGPTSNRTDLEARRRIGVSEDAKENQQGHA